MNLFLQFLLDTPPALIGLIAASLLGAYVFWIIVRDRRKWRKAKKEILRLENEQRAIFGLPPAKRWDE